MIKRLSLALLLSICVLSLLSMNFAYAAEEATNTTSPAKMVLKEGTALYKSLKFVEAQALLDNATRQFPKDAEIRQLLGLSAFGAGNYEVSISALEWVAKQRPNDALVKLRLAEAYRKSAAQSRAAKKYDQANKLEGLAEATYATAYKMLKEAAETSSENVEINNALGIAALGMKDYSVAVTAFTKVLEQDPANKAARTSMAGAYYRLGQDNANEGMKDLSIKNFIKAQEEFAVICKDFTASYQGKQLPVPGTPEYPTFSLLYLNLAQSAQEAGDYPAAIEAFETLLEVNPNDGGTWLKLAHLYTANSQQKKAKAAYQKSYAMLNTTSADSAADIDMLYSLAQAALGAGKNDEAINHYQQIIDLDPSRHAAQLALAELYRRGGDADKAKVTYLEVYEKLQDKYLWNPTDSATNYLLARAAMGAEDYEAAVMAYERVLVSNPDLDLVRVDLAAAYLQLGSKIMAEAEYQRIVDYSENEPLKESAQKWITALQSADQRNFIIGSLSTSYTRDSNPRSDPISTTIPTTIGNVYLDKDLSHKKLDAANGYTAILRHTYLTPIEPLEWRTTFLWFGTYYHHLDSEDSNYYSIKSGPAATIGNLDIELSGLINGYEKDWETYSKGHGFELNLLYPVNSHFLVGGGYKLENRKLYQDRNTDVRNHSLSLWPTVAWGAENENRLALTINYQAEYGSSGGDYRDRLKSSRHLDTFHSIGGGLRYSRDLAWGLTPYVNYYFREVRYTSRNALFEEPRKDHVHTYGMGVTKTLPRNFSLELAHQRTRAYSNIPLDDYRRNTTSITLTRMF